MIITRVTLKADLHFPEKLHDKFKEIPPAPETLTPDIDWLTPYQRDIGDNTGIINDGVVHGANKLVPHLYDHKKSHSLQETKVPSRSRGSGNEDA